MKNQPKEEPVSTQPEKGPIEVHTETKYETWSILSPELTASLTFDAVDPNVTFTVSTEMFRVLLGRAGFTKV